MKTTFPALFFLWTVSLLSPLAANGAEPHRQQLWLYYPTNLQVNDNVAKLEVIWKRAAAAGYTHVLLADSKFARLGGLGDMERVYFANVARVKTIAAENGLTLVPALFSIGYSNDLLYHDPNLAEGLPVKDSLFVVKGAEARLVPDPPVALEKLLFKDDVVAMAGGEAVVTESDQNSRFAYEVRVSPFRCYHVSVKIKTENYRGTPEVKALAGEQSLQWQNLGVQPTQDWAEHHVVFNSLDNAKVNVYFGVWGGGRGSLRWKDWRVEEVGLLNVLRRPGTPVVVKRDNTGDELVEGRDFERIEDPLMGTKPWPGEYTAWHEPPPIKTKLPDGTRLRVSWYHPAIIYDGQVSCCLSEPKLYEILADQAKRMKAAWGADAYMMSHDEIRTLNWCDACQDRKLSPGQILADNVRRCAELLKPAGAYVWSDMFDPHHNAAKGNYYLVRGDLTGSWEGLDRSVTVVNWNFGRRDESLRFFADRGHKQLIAGYYDGDVARVKDWAASAARVDGVVGYMYTTWVSNYDDLEAFAEACRSRAAPAN